MNQHHIYIISDGQFCKIGHSRDPEGRLAQVMTGNPYELELCDKYRFPDRSSALAIEAEAHAVLRDLHVRGEWFRVSTQQARTAIELASAIVGHFRFEYREAIVLAFGTVAPSSGDKTIDKMRREMRKRAALEVWNAKATPAVTPTVTSGNA
jgi:hypothetical protein